MKHPESESIVCHRGKSIMARLSPGTDLLEGIIHVCIENDITYAVIVSAIGSLEHAGIVYVVPDETARIGVRYVPPARIKGPLELLSAQGMIGLTTDSRTSIHLHGIVSDPRMRVFGGHFIEGEAPILATSEIFIQEVEKIAMVRQFDQPTGFEMFKLFKTVPGP